MDIADLEVRAPVQGLRLSSTPKPRQETPGPVWLSLVASNPGDLKVNLFITTKEDVSRWTVNHLPGASLVTTQQDARPIHLAAHTELLGNSLLESPKVQPSPARGHQRPLASEPAVETIWLYHSPYHLTSPLTA